MGLDGNGVVLVLPQPGEHGPAEAQGEQSDELTQTLGMTEVGGFEVEASGFEGGEEGLNAPAQAVIDEGGFGVLIRGQNQEFAIGEADGDDINPSAPDPSLPRQNPSFPRPQTGQDPFSPLARPPRTGANPIAMTQPEAEG